MESQDYLLKQAEILGKVLRELIGRMIPLSAQECKDQLQEMLENGELANSPLAEELTKDNVLNQWIKDNAFTSDDFSLLLEYFLIRGEKCKAENKLEELIFYRNKVTRLTSVSNLSFEMILRVNQLNTDT